jgi:hypothetical protein
MFWSKKPTISDPQFGLLAFANGEWCSKALPSPAGNLLVSIAGDRSAPSPAGLACAREIFQNAARVVSAAAAFVRADANAIAFMENNGSLVVDGFSVSATPGSFTVDFGLTDWPDAALNVRFADGMPFEVWLGD